MICKIQSCGVCDIFMSFPHISLIYHLLDVTLFSFQGTIFKNMFILRRTSFFFLGSPGKAVGFFGVKEEQGGGFTNSRLADLFSSRLCSDVVEMRRIELLTPCLQGRCSPSWATPPNLSWYFVINSLPYIRTACAVSSSSELQIAHSFVSLQLILLQFGFSSRLPRTSVRNWAKKFKMNKIGGPKWTRTTDLTLIRRAL